MVCLAPSPILLKLDWMVLIGYEGFLHGAYFEGLNVTNKLADCLDSGGCTGFPHIDSITLAWE